MADTNAKRALRRGRLRSGSGMFLALWRSGGRGAGRGGVRAVTKPQGRAGGASSTDVPIGPFDLGRWPAGCRAATAAPACPADDRSGSEHRLLVVDAAGNPVSAKDVHTTRLLIDNSEPTPPVQGAAALPDRDGATRCGWATPTPTWVGSDRWDSLWHVMNMSDTARPSKSRTRSVPASATASTRRVEPSSWTSRLRHLGVRRSRDGAPGCVHTRSRTGRRRSTGSRLRRDTARRRIALALRPNADLRCTMSAVTWTWGGETGPDDLGMIESIPGLNHCKHGVSGRPTRGALPHESPSPGRWGSCWPTSGGTPVRVPVASRPDTVIGCDGAVQRGTSGETSTRISRDGGNAGQVIGGSGEPGPQPHRRGPGPAPRSRDGWGAGKSRTRSTVPGSLRPAEKGPPCRVHTRRSAGRRP